MILLFSSIALLKKQTIKKRPATNQPWKRPCVWANMFSQTPQCENGVDLTPVDIHRINLIKRSYEVGIPKPAVKKIDEENLLTKEGKTMMLKKKEENQNYAETCRQKEMSDWKNRRRLISTAKATQYRHGVWTPNMHVKEEFTNKMIETAYLNKKDYTCLADKPLQGKSFYSGIPHRFVD